jgi:mxaJ protein
VRTDARSLAAAPLAALCLLAAACGAGDAGRASSVASGDAAVSVAASREAGDAGAPGEASRAGGDAGRVAAASPAAALPSGTKATDEAGRRALRVCADPNNLPFSNARGEGFENRIAAVLADEMGARVRYTWWAQRRGFVRNTLRAGACDLVVGVPSAFELAMTTRPYYRSTYVFVQRRDAPFRVRSFDDAVLRRLTVGVQMVGDDYANTPPAHALAARGMRDNVRGYLVAGDYARPSPPARIVEAVARGEVDVAVAWGPMAAYFARRSPVPLTVTPVSPEIDLPFLPFVFDVSMGVRRDDAALLSAVETALERRRGEVDAILAEYGVPRLDLPREES